MAMLYVHTTELPDGSGRITRVAAILVENRTVTDKMSRLIEKYWIGDLITDEVPAHAIADHGVPLLSTMVRLDRMIAVASSVAMYDIGQHVEAINHAHVTAKLRPPVMRLVCVHEMACQALGGRITVPLHTAYREIAGADLKLSADPIQRGIDYCTALHTLHMAIEAARPGSAA